MDDREKLQQAERILAYLREKRLQYGPVGLNLQCFIAQVERRAAALRQKLGQKERH